MNKDKHTNFLNKENMASANLDTQVSPPSTPIISGNINDNFTKAFAGNLLGQYNNAYFKELQQQVRTGQSVWVAPDATVIGKVHLSDGVSIWYGTRIRGDLDEIYIGSRTNIQENSILHVDVNQPIQLGSDLVVGHGAMIHSCVIGDCTLVGMRATILNRARIGRGCVIGANALITEDMVIPDFSMVLGVPGKIVKRLPDVVADKVKWGASVYTNELKKYLNETDGVWHYPPPKANEA